MLNERTDVGKIRPTAGTHLRLALGDRLGTYEIVDLRGAGGMAELYRACDTRLGREVAIKVLSERVRRLSRACSPRRLTFESDDAGPVWSPGGSSIAYGSRADARPFNLFLTPSNDAVKQEGNPTPLTLVLNWTTELKR